jgi:predicted ATP-dependent endonuclease of OLD family
MTSRLALVSTRSLPGLPDVDVALEPVTALIGPRATGKSRLLWAISWLLSGEPSLGPVDSDMSVTAIIESDSGRRSISRGRGATPPADMPATRFLAARDRLPSAAQDVAGMTDAALAEQMLADMADRVRRSSAGELLLIEEPELMLTPQQQRRLYGLLRIHATRNQVIYSTRSPALLDAVHHHEIVRLDYTSAGLVVSRAGAEILSIDERFRLQAEFDHERTEMFFATAVVLVEGQTERQTLPVIFRSLGHDPDALGISIVEVGGKGNLVLVARVLGELRIPHVIIHDSDRGHPGAAENAVIRRNAGDAPVIELDPDFEGVAGIHSHEDKVLHAWRRFAGAAPERIPEPFQRIVNTTVRLAREASQAG